MVLYSIILFLAAVPMIILSMAIYQGRIDLIHDYHQRNVTDKAAYGKAFGKAMLVLSASLLLSGIIGLFGASKAVAMAAVAVLILGLLIGIAWILGVQKKYNKGLF